MSDPRPYTSSLSAAPIAPEDRTLVMVEHLSPLANLVLPALGNVLGALIAWLALRDRAGVLDAQGKAVVNFQLSLSLYFLVLCALGILTLGIGFLLLWPLLLALYVLQIVTMILAVIATTRGQPYRYPLSIRFLR